MSTGAFLVKYGYHEIGGDSVNNEATGDELARGFVALKSMLGQWQDIGIRLDTNELKVIGDDVGEPQSTTMTIIFNLALWLAGPASVGSIKVVSQELRDNANNSYAMMKTVYQVFDIPQVVISSTTPRGQGNFYNRFDRTFFREEEELSG